jgi:predicted ArsR family transcriptional regulator
VAQEFPELCEAEQQAIAEVLGTHVQRLSSIVNGDCACTTHVPLAQTTPLAQTIPLAPHIKQGASA